MSQKAAFVMTYGKSGVGKTTDAGFAFPNALYIAAPGALRSITSTCGYTPASANANTIPEATALLKQQSDFDAYVFDDFSFLAQQTLKVIEQSLTGWKVFGKMIDVVLEFRSAARYSDKHIVLNSWEKAPRFEMDRGNKTGKILARGGPDLSGKAAEQLPAMCDLVMRAAYDPRYSPWPASYSVRMSSQWISKDRDSGCPSPAPMNLREVLRANGYALSRHAGLPWQEDQCQALYEQIVDWPEGERKTALERAYGEIMAQYGRHAAGWTVRDVNDRCLIEKANTKRFSTFF